MISPSSSRLIKKIIPYVIIWFSGGLIYALIEKGILGESAFYPSTGNFYAFDVSLFAVLSLSIVLGTVLGITEEYLFKKLLRKKSFFLKLIFKTALYLSIIVGTLMLSTLTLNSLLMQLPPSHPDVLETVSNFVFNFVFFSINIYTGFFIGLSLFFSEMVDHIGVNGIVNFFTGRYANSKVEDRVFMFLDMRSSTAIAEKLGHEKYYQLLNSYYADMTEPILATAGEIYQYVGDEIVVSWPCKVGIKQANCIRCFFLIQDEMKRRCKYYEDTFGLSPEFKAGLHVGNVTTGEVGLIKKEILFTGDVLNTTSRIQDLCNEQEVDILLSGELLASLDLKDEFKKINKGSFELRGRDQIVKLFTLERA